MKSFGKIAAVAAMALAFIGAGATDTNEVGPSRWAAFHTTGTLWVTLDSTDLAGNALRTWRHITRVRLVESGTGSGTVQFGAHMQNGWSLCTFIPDTAEWSDEFRMADIAVIDGRGATAKGDTVAVMVNGGVDGKLFLMGD